MYRQGKAVLIAAVAIDEKAVDEDFLPLTVQYMEKAYAAAKIPGGFIKRETKPGDFETLTSRIIDRSLRPLFPSGFHFPVTITVMVVSSDSEVDMQVAALHAASAALYVSDIPVTQSIAAVRVGKIENEMLINPTLSQQDESVLDLLVVGSGKDILMIEMRTMASESIDDVEVDMIDPMMGAVPLVLEHQACNELDEEALVSAIALAGEAHPCTNCNC
jgi:polyribonucleotide nucleotidyltransferase